MLRLPPSRNPYILSDWAEASVLFTNRNLSWSTIFSTLQAQDTPNPDQKTSDVWRELRRRRRLFQGGYPFTISNSTLSRRLEWQETIWYSFMLMLSLHSQYSDKSPRGGWRVASKNFERMAEEATSLYLHGPSINIGAPRDGRTAPHGFRDTLQLISDASKEPMGLRLAENKASQDAGADVVSWIHFPDERPGKIALLVNCKCSGDIKSLATELSVGLWTDLISWAVPPVSAFAFPYVCPERDWFEVSRKGGMLLDRVRLVHLQHRRTRSSSYNPIRLWCREEARFYSLLRLN